MNQAAIATVQTAVARLSAMPSSAFGLAGVASFETYMATGAAINIKDSWAI